MQRSDQELKEIYDKVQNLVKQENILLSDAFKRVGTSKATYYKYKSSIASKLKKPKVTHKKVIVMPLTTTLGETTQAEIDQMVAVVFVKKSQVSSLLVTLWNNQ